MNRNRIPIALLLFAVMAIGSLVAPSAMGAANPVTNSFGGGSGPYTNDFEQYGVGVQLTQGNGVDGWYAEEDDAVVITNHPLPNATHPYADDRGSEDEYPLTNSAHFKMFQLNSDATNVIEGLDTDGTPFYVDMLLQPRRWEEEEHPDIPADNRTAVYFNSNGYLMAYARYFVQSNSVWETNWLEFTDFSLASNKWVRLTISMDMAEDSGQDFFRIRLDGQLLQHPWGASDIVGSGITNNPGPWLQCTDWVFNNSVSNLLFKGTGNFDDLVVTTNDPIKGERVSVLVSIDPNNAAYTTPGNIKTEGTIVYEKKPTSDELQVFSASALQYYITNVIVNGTNDVLTFTGFEPFGGALNHTAKFASMDSNQTVVVQLEGIPQTLNVTNNGFGSVTPAPGDHTNYHFGNVVTASISYASVMTTSTQRHYCAWTGSGSVPTGGGSGETNYSVVFTIAQDGGFGFPDATPGISSITWDWHLQYKLDTAYTSTNAGFTTADGSVTASDWHRTNDIVTIWATNPVGDVRWTNASWSGDTDGCTPVNGQSGLQVPMDKPRSITANFVYAPAGGPWTLTVDDGGYGTPVPGTTAGIADGTQMDVMMSGSPVIVSATTQIACVGWTGTGRVPATGTDTNTGTLLISEDSSITWLWETQVKLDLAVNLGSGSIEKSPDQMYYATNETVQLTANPHLGYTFLNWVVMDGDTNGIDVSSSQISVSMTNARNLQVNFSTSGPLTGPLGTTSTWYQAYGIHTNYTDMDEAEQGDADGDGQVNWVEFVAGTDPSDNTSMFRVVTNLSAPGSNCVVWYSTTNSGVATPFSMYRTTSLDGSTSYTNWPMVRTNDIPRTTNLDGLNAWWDTDVSGTNTHFYVPVIEWVY